MDDAPAILAFAGSARKDSWNKKLVKIAAAGAHAAGAAITLIDLRDFPMPLYDGDDESENGVPANALKLRELILSHQGQLLASPEYNGLIVPLLKNVIDWTSRPVDCSPGLAAYPGKQAALLSISLGSFGDCAARSMCAPFWATSVCSSCQSNWPWGWRMRHLLPMTR